MGSALTAIFLWLKVPFGLLFGITIGFMALVPFGGTVGIVLTTLLVALQDVWLGFRVLIAAVIVQQILDNLVAPRILGSVTGLNPVWILISVLTGARVGGLLGVIVAVPTAVVIKTALTAVRSNAAQKPLPATEGSSKLNQATVEATKEEKQVHPDSPSPTEEGLGARS